MVQTDTEIVSFTIEQEDGTTDTVSLPKGLIALFNDEDAPQAEVVGDLTLLVFAERAHMLVHHSDEEVGEEIKNLEQTVRELFEERFELSFEEATGHSH
ncbi:MAG: hypothetical protein ABEI06_10765 [Halobacteriaceae archaeon]